MKDDQKVAAELEKQYAGKGFQKGAWITCLVIFAAGVFLAIAQYKPYGVLGNIMTDLATDATTGGWIMSIFNLVGIILVFPAVAIIRKVGIRTAGLISLGFAIVGGVIGYFAGDIAALLVSRVIEGVGLGLIGVIAPTAFNMWFPIEKRGVPMGLWSAWQVCGITLAFWFGLPIADAFGGDWKSLWIVAIVFLVVGLILYAIFVKPPKSENNHADVTEDDVTTFGVLKYKNVYLMLLAGFAFGISQGTVISWISPYWQACGLETQLSNILTGAMYGLEIIGCVIGGLILSKIVKRRRFIVIDSIIWCVSFFLMFRVGGDSVNAVPMVGMIIFSALFYAVVESVYTAAMWALVGQSVPDPRYAAGAIALFQIGVFSGMMLGPVFGGMIIDAGLDWGTMSYYVCIAQVVATVAYAIMKMYDAKGNVVKI